MGRPLLLIAAALALIAGASGQSFAEGKGKGWAKGHGASAWDYPPGFSSPGKRKGWKGRTPPGWQKGLRKGWDGDRRPPGWW